MIGRRFGRLQVIEETKERDSEGRVKYFCKCDCGGSKITVGKSLRRGFTKSCGCIQTEILIKRNEKHGMAYHHLYYVFVNMKTRCTNPRTRSWVDYGERGIKIEWSSFEDFFADMNPSFEEHAAKFGKKDTQIDRIDVNGNYSKANCRWVTRKEQNQNKRNNHFITFNGQTRNITEWSRIIGISQAGLSRRIRAKWPIDKALKPVL